MQDVCGSLSALICENNVALFRDDAGVECAAVTRVNQVLGSAGAPENRLADEPNASVAGVRIGNFTALSGEYKIIAGMDCLP